MEYRSANQEYRNMDNREAEEHPVLSTHQDLLLLGSLAPMCVDMHTNAHGHAHRCTIAHKCAYVLVHARY